MHCLSIPIHEKLEVVTNQIDNIRKFFPESYIILHVSLGGFHLREPLREQYRNSESVFINDKSYPTSWGWMFHTHLLNYLFAKRIGLNFDYFITEASNSMFFKHGTNDFLKSYDFFMLTAPLHLRPTDCRLRHFGGSPQQPGADKNFERMVKELSIAERYTSRHEGSAFKFELFEEMMKILERYYLWDLTEPHYGQEEIYLATLARHLSNSHSNQLTITYVMTEAHIEACRKADAKALRLESCWADIDDDWPNRFFATKPVARDLKDPMRQYINSLD